MNLDYYAKNLRKLHNHITKYTFLYLGFFLIGYGMLKGNNNVMIIGLFFLTAFELHCHEQRLDIQSERLNRHFNRITQLHNEIREFQRRLYNLENKGKK